MKTPGKALLVVIAILVCLSSSAIHAQVNPGPVRAVNLDQAELARQILSDDIVQRSGALSAVERMGLQNTGRELRAALFAALQKEANVHTQRYYAGRRGEALDDLPDPEFIGKLSTAVARLRDPEAIPALAAALPIGSLVSRALADFGEPAVAPVLQVVTSPDGWYDAVSGGLLALRFMIERRGEHPLTANTIARIRRAAEQRLTGKQRFTTLWRAIDLAAVLGDADLWRILEALASDPNEVFARGVEDPDLIQLTQKQAADRLAGIPPLPRP